MSAAHLREELARGWSSPETYAAHLHLTADKGLVRTAGEALKVAEAVEGTVTRVLAGTLLEGLLQRHLEELDDAALDEEYRAIRKDVGSFWRVDWAEVGAAFLGESHAA